MTPALSAVRIATDDVERCLQVFGAISGSEPTPKVAEAELALGSALLRFDAATAGASAPAGTPGTGPSAARRGITGVEIVVDDLRSRVEVMGNAGVTVAADGDRATCELSGVEVRLSERDGWPAAGARESATGARLDHVALLVGDLDAATDQWEVVTGVMPERMGLHPISGGAFSATRLHLGPAMVELVSPTPGLDSPLARRLASHGEGPATLALPVTDLDQTLGALRELEVRVDWRDPHWMVHPRDASGVLVQLTPRVEH
jgi:catechol 2,3-dioxygenase-like lactoylglutathione lyase family enzyme